MSNGTILLIDDEVTYLKTIIKYLEEEAEPYDLLQALSVDQAFAILQKETPELIIVDWDMPGKNGIEFIQTVKQQEQLKDIPIIMSTGIMTSAKNLQTALEAGATDYIRKPIDHLELRARVRSMMALGASIKQVKIHNTALQNEIRERALAMDKLQASELKLRQSYDKMEMLARTDALTKLPNRRDIMEKIDQEKSRSNRTVIPFVLALVDIDKFKNINDSYGHDCGDYVLVQLGEIFRTTIRKQDHVGRWGGEEFLFLLPETQLDEAVIVAQKLRAKVATCPVEFNQNILDVTITIGVCECSTTRKVEDCLKKCDDALYRGKEGGRNCVVTGDNQWPVY